MPDNTPDSEEAIRRGEYSVIRSLVRVLEVKRKTSNTTALVTDCIAKIKLGSNPFVLDPDRFKSA